MRYRQWKKELQKQHGINPPAELDRKKQRKIMRRALRNMENTDIIEVASRVQEVFAGALAEVMRELGKTFDAAGTACRNIADSLRPLEIKGHIFNWEVQQCYKSDQLEYTRQTKPEKVKSPLET